MYESNSILKIIILGHLKSFNEAKYYSGFTILQDDVTLAHGLGDLHTESKLKIICILIISFVL